MGPAVLITIGVLFLLDQTRGGYLSFGNTWPVILVVIGIVSLASALSSMEGHISGSVPPAAPGAPGPAPNAPPPPFSGQGQGQ
jgi:cell wall-active antibiotic response 4TMS protein YvqF